MANRFFIFLMFLAPYSIAQTSDPKAAGQAFAGTPPINGTLVRTTYYQGDTIPYVVLNPVKCYTERKFKNKRQQAAWDRTKYNVKKVYPYAILAAAKLKEYDRILARMSESDKEKYTKLVEKQLKDEFTEQLKQLTESQGRILIKLIDRETGKTTYTVVKELRGSFSAFMYQGVALMFGSNLKSEYDPQGNDKAIEEAIRLVENGDF
jgi:hypothetical protein